MYVRDGLRENTCSGEKINIYVFSSTLVRISWKEVDEASSPSPYFSMRVLAYTACRDMAGLSQPKELLTKEE